MLEYPLTLAVLPLLCLRPRRGGASNDEVPVPGRVPALAAMLVVLGVVIVTRLVAAVPETVTVFLVIALFGLLGYVLSKLPAATSACLVAAVVLLSMFGDGDITQRERTFYGTYEIRASGDLASLSHGTTLHGLQSRVAGEEQEPATYYARSGPLGDIMEVDQPRDVVAVGLGIGTLAAYGRPGDTYTFLEIDQTVVDIARDERYFTYLSGSDADVSVQVGDGRLLAGELPPLNSDLVILDAFSSDAIPVHLLTHEAFDVYAEGLRDDGAIAVHISNRHFDLVPVLASAADHLGWEGVVRNYAGGDSLSTPSKWVLLTADNQLMHSLTLEPGWSSMSPSRRVPWTDDYSSVLTILR